MEIAAQFSALSDPTRLAIVERLATEGEISATDLARPFGISQPAVSRHIKLLEEAGWVSRRVSGTRRLIRLEPARLDALIVWLGAIRARIAARVAHGD